MGAGNAPGRYVALENNSLFWLFQFCRRGFLATTLPPPPPWSLVLFWAITSISLWPADSIPLPLFQMLPSPQQNLLWPLRSTINWPSSKFLWLIAILLKLQNHLFVCLVKMQILIGLVLEGTWDPASSCNQLPGDSHAAGPGPQWTEMGALESNSSPADEGKSHRWIDLVTISLGKKPFNRNERKGGATWGKAPLFASGGGWREEMRQVLITFTGTGMRQV